MEELKSEERMINDVILEQFNSILQNITHVLEGMDSRLENIEGWIADYVPDGKKESELKD